MGSTSRRTDPTCTRSSSCSTTRPTSIRRTRSTAATSSATRVSALERWAHDTDDTSEWKTILADAGKIGTSLGPAVTAINAPAGAITTGVAATASLISDLIPTNEDDQLGHASYNLVNQTSRW